MDEFVGWEGNALSDLSFFGNLGKIQVILSIRFYYSSSHHPFTYFEDYDFDVGDLQGTL